MGSPHPPLFKTVQNSKIPAPSSKSVKLQYCPEGYVCGITYSIVMVILGFFTIPWLGPKDMEPHASSVPKVKLGHWDHMCNLS